MVKFASIFANLLAGVPRYHHIARDSSLQTRQTLNCVSTASGRFGLFPNSVSSASSAGESANCTGDNLVVQLDNGILTDSLNQTAGIITGQRFVFGDPSSLGDTNDWRMCFNGSLALLGFNSATDFWECGPSEYLYLEQINSTCSENNLVLAPCSTASSTETTSTTTSSSSILSSSPTLSSSSTLSSPTAQLTSGINPATSPTLATTTSTSPTSIATSPSSSTDSGISYSAKLGLGIGLGIGVPLLLLALLTWCLISRGTLLGRKRPASKFEPGVAIDDEPGVAVSETNDAGTFIR